MSEHKLTKRQREMLENLRDGHPLHSYVALGGYRRIANSMGGAGHRASIRLEDDEFIRWHDRGGFGAWVLTDKGRLAVGDAKP